MSSLPQEKITELTQFAEKLADAAATVTLAYFRQKPTVDNKLSDGAFDPVTEGDRGAEKAIRALIDATYPDHAIHGEEFGVKDTGSPFKWVLDPIDGTRAFISGLPTWGTLIALLYKGRPIIGVIDQPYIGERYTGFPGGATLNGSPITARSCASISDATLSTTDPSLFTGADRQAFDKLCAEVQLVRYGLDCYAYAVLASGFMDIVAENRLQSYDMMALVPVIRGAGGVAVNWDGGEPAEGGSLLALGDGRLKDGVLRLLTGWNQDQEMC